MIKLISECELWNCVDIFKCKNLAWNTQHLCVSLLSTVEEQKKSQTEVTDVKKHQQINTNKVWGQH